MKSPFRIGTGYDVHALEIGNSLVIGGIKIKHNKSAIAHSDGDVLIHAICDALLGALSLGDIGVHFPDNDEIFKGIDSKILLEKSVSLVRKKGYEIVNIDSTIIAQKPRLKPHIPNMVEQLSNVLNISIEDISIKATTTELLGFEGKEEGIAAQASVLLYLK